MRGNRVSADSLGARLLASHRGISDGIDNSICPLRVRRICLLFIQWPLSHAPPLARSLREQKLRPFAQMSFAARRELPMAPWDEIKNVASSFLRTFWSAGSAAVFSTVPIGCASCVALSRAPSLTGSCERSSNRDASRRFPFFFPPPKFLECGSFARPFCAPRLFDARKAYPPGAFPVGHFSSNLSFPLHRSFFCLQPLGNAVSLLLFWNRFGVSIKRAPPCFFFQTQPFGWDSLMAFFLKLGALRHLFPP